jgi:hypothetical protein
VEGGNGYVRVEGKMGDCPSGIIVVSVAIQFALLQIEKDG